MTAVYRYRWSDRLITAQVGGFGVRVCSYSVLYYIHQINQMNSAMTITTTALYVVLSSRPSIISVVLVYHTGDQTRASSLIWSVLRLLGCSCSSPH